MRPTLVSASAQTPAPTMLGGAHVPVDVVPPRPEPFLPKRQAEFDETAGSPGVRPVGAPVSGMAGPGGGNLGSVPAGPAGPNGSVGSAGSNGSAATAAAVAPDSPVIERDPNVNRSLMLRLIAGVRGL